MLQSNAKVTLEVSELRQYTDYKDCVGKKIFIGDTVKFLTKGRFDSTTGKVTGYSRTRVLSEDYKNARYLELQPTYMYYQLSKDE